jgi:GTP cyclohydrolase I
MTHPPDDNRYQAAPDGPVYGDPVRGIQAINEAASDMRLAEAVEEAGGDPDVYMAALLLARTTGLDVNSEHGSETPTRFVKMLRDMTTRDEEFKFTVFPNEDKVDEMVTQCNIPFYTFCNHHVVPFFGKAHVAYIPGEKIVGLSKLSRAVVWLAKGLHVQELLTTEIADYLEGKLNPLGVGVVLEAEHMCMAMRGAKIANVPTTTAAMRGVFADHSKTAKAEFMATIERHTR